MAKKSGAFGKTAGYILLGLLLVGLGGFGATNFGGSVRSIGTVGETEIPVDGYFRGLQQEIRAIEAETGQALSFPQARAMGLTDRALSQSIITAALKDEAARLQISIGDARLAEQLLQESAFHGADGSFDRDIYRLRLESANLSEREFEEQLRSDSANTLLQGAVIAGVDLPDTYVDTLLAYTGEQRGFSWVDLGAAPDAAQDATEAQNSDTLDTGTEVPSDTELRAFYEDNIAAYTQPETRRLTYAWLTPDMIVDTVEVDEDSLRAAYEERTEEFNLPERRLVERLVFGDSAAAEAALARITSGEAPFETLVLERDLALSDTDLGDVTRDDLGAAAEAVFAANIGDVVIGDSPLGAALFRVNAVLDAVATSYEEAVPMLRDTLALDRARRVIDTASEDYDNELAGGMTLEELTDATDMRLGEIGWTGAEAEGIAGYDAFRDAAEAVSEGDYPAIDQLGDGGVFALRLDTIQPAAPIAFDEVRARVEADFERNARAEALAAKGEDLKARLEAGEDFAALGLEPTVEAPMTRTAFGAQLPPGALQAVFELDTGAVTVLTGEGTAYLIRLDEITPADLENETAAQLVQLVREQAAQDVAQDLFRAMAVDIQARAGVNIDQAAVNAVHANFQ